MRGPVHSRWLLALLCAMALGGERLLPQEHVHRHLVDAADDQHGHSEIHRHFSPHNSSQGHARVAAADDDAELIDTVYVRTVRVTHAPAAAAVVTFAQLAVGPDVTPGRSVRTDVSLSSHDPPWDVPTPRGPPL